MARGVQLLRPTANVYCFSARCDGFFLPGIFNSSISVQGMQLSLLSHVRTISLLLLNHASPSCAFYTLSFCSSDGLHADKSGLSGRNPASCIHIYLNCTYDLIDPHPTPHSCSCRLSQLSNIWDPFRSNNRHEAATSICLFSSPAFQYRL